MKTCSGCKKEYLLLEFVVDKKSKDGRGYSCKQCRYDLNREYVNKNREKLSEKAKIYYQTSGKAIIKKNGKTPKARDTQKKRREAQKDIFREYIKKYRVEKKDKIRKTSREYSKNRSRTDNNFRIANNLRHRLRMALKNSSKIGSHINDLGCNIEFLIKYLESIFYKSNLTGELMSWENYGSGPKKWQIDHKKALCLFDLTNKEQFLRACHYTNLQPLWHEDHVVKTVKDLEQRCGA